MDYIPLLALGILFIVLGYFNFKGNISSIHWYNRRKVLPEDVPSYGKVMGIGTIIIGASLMLTAVLQMLFEAEALYSITVAGTVVGLGFMLYGQIKYNHGIF